MSNLNLLTETLEDLDSHGKSRSDVVWVGSSNGEYAMSWEEFAEIANIYYYSGFGGAEIATDLVVVGQDWWLERHEYDGSEWWEFKELPERKADAKKFGNTKCGYWRGLGG